MNFESGNFYHIFNRGNNSQKVFFNRENYFFFLRKMNEHLLPYSSIVAWCLMPNHFHWVIYVHHNKIEITEDHAMTSRHSMTKTTIGPNEEVLPAAVTHSMTSSHTMTNSSNTVVIGIGSNIDAEKNIPKMLDILKLHVEVVKVSSFIVTKPIGITNQPDFTNGAVKVKTNLDQENLKSLLKTIEDKLGRDRSVPKFGPRNIDLDIVVWNGKIVDDDYYTRYFLQKSVQEIL